MVPLPRRVVPWHTYRCSRTITMSWWPTLHLPSCTCVQRKSRHLQRSAYLDTRTTQRHDFSPYWSKLPLRFPYVPWPGRMQFKSSTEIERKRHLSSGCDPAGEFLYSVWFGVQRSKWMHCPWRDVGWHSVAVMRHVLAPFSSSSNSFATFSVLYESLHLWYNRLTVPYYRRLSTSSWCKYGVSNTGAR